MAMYLKGVILFIVALTMALSLSITLTMQGIDQQQQQQQQQQQEKTLIPSSEDKFDLKLPSKRVSRFLAQNLNARNPNAADHCHKDHEICYLTDGKNSTCCNNKCVDLAYDDKNCGACKNKCKFTQTCCRGECVELAYDKRHCGYCNHRCEPGEYCVYGLCNYA